MTGRDVFSCSISHVYPPLSTTKVFVLPDNVSSIALSLYTGVVFFFLSKIALAVNKSLAGSIFIRALDDLLKENIGSVNRLYSAMYIDETKLVLY